MPSGKRLSLAGTQVAHLAEANSNSPTLAAVAGAREPAWIAESELLSNAHSLAEHAHGLQRRPTDTRLFLEHVVEVAALLHKFGFDDELIAAGLLHDSVERGKLDAEELRREIGEPISLLVLTLSEDPAIEPFDKRKTALRDQVAAAGVRAITIFAADKLDDIAGLRRGIHEFGTTAVEERLGTSVGDMADHYRESVEMIASKRPGSVFLSALRTQLDRLSAEA